MTQHPIDRAKVDVAYCEGMRDGYTNAWNNIKKHYPDCPYVEMLRNMGYRFNQMIPGNRPEDIIDRYNERLVKTGQDAVPNPFKEKRLQEEADKA